MPAAIQRLGQERKRARNNILSVSVAGQLPTVAPGRQLLGGIIVRGASKATSLQCNQRWPPTRPRPTNLLFTLYDFPFSFFRPPTSQAPLGTQRFTHSSSSNTEILIPYPALPLLLRGMWSFVSKWQGSSRCGVTSMWSRRL